jgi:hypothetical protein
MMSRSDAIGSWFCTCRHREHRRCSKIGGGKGVTVLKHQKLEVHVGATGSIDAGVGWGEGGESSGGGCRVVVRACESGREDG